MTIEENIRIHIHNMRGLKKLIFRITFKFLKVYIKCADEILEKKILELKQSSDVENIRLDRIERTAELHYVMLTDGIDLKIKEALQK